MRKVGSAITVGRALTIISISALAIVTGLLVVIALQVRVVPEAGATPDASTTQSVDTPTPSPTSSVESTPTPPPPTDTASRQLAIADSGVGVRADDGACGGPAAVVEQTQDGGVTWQPVSVDGTEIHQVLSITLIGADQVDLLVRDASCVPTMVSSFTGGQFWQAYPDRASGATYVDPTQNTQIVHGGIRLDSPCGSARRLVTAPARLVISCDGGIFQYSDQSQLWSAVTTDVVGDVATDAEGTLVYGVELADAQCDGISVRAFALQPGAVVPAGQCAPTQTGGDQVAIASSADFLWIWSDNGVFRSPIGTSEWSSVQ